MNNPYMSHILIFLTYKFFNLPKVKSILLTYNLFLSIAHEGI